MNNDNIIKAITQILWKSVEKPKGFLKLNIIEVGKFKYRVNAICVRQTESGIIQENYIPKNGSWYVNKDFEFSPKIEKEEAQPENSYADHSIEQHLETVAG